MNFHLSSRPSTSLSLFIFLLSPSTTTTTEKTSLLRDGPLRPRPPLAARHGGAGRRRRGRARLRRVARRRAEPGSESRRGKRREERKRRANERRHRAAHSATPPLSSSLSPVSPSRFSAFTFHERDLCNALHAREAKRRGTKPVLLENRTVSPFGRASSMPSLSPSTSTSSSSTSLFNLLLFSSSTNNSFRSPASPSWTGSRRAKTP